MPQVSADIIVGGLVVLAIAFVVFRKINEMFEQDIKKMLQGLIDNHNVSEAAHKDLRSQLRSLEKTLEKIELMLERLDDKLDKLPCHVNFCGGHNHESAD